MEHFTVDHGISVQPPSQLLRWDRHKLSPIVDTVVLQSHVDLGHWYHRKFALGELTGHRAPQTVGVCPGPFFLLAPGSAREGNLVDLVLGDTVINKRKYGDPLRWVRLIVRRYLEVSLAGIDFNQMVEPGLAPMLSDALFREEKRPLI